MLIEPKIIIIIILLVASFLFGLNYLNKASSDINSLICGINKMEKNIRTNTRTIRKLLIIDNKLLTKSLSKSTTHNEIDSKTDSMYSYIKIIKGDSNVVKDLSSLIENKNSIYKQITSFNNKEVDFNKVKKTKKISIVSKNTKRGIFKKKVSYDTISRGYNELDIDAFKKEYSEVIKHNNDRLSTLIKVNNQLTLSMKLFIGEYTKKENSKLLKEKEKNLNNLINKFSNYIIVLSIFIVVIIVLLYFLISDIIKIINNNKRNDNIVPILLNSLKKRKRDK